MFTINDILLCKKWEHKKCLDEKYRHYDELSNNFSELGWSNWQHFQIVLAIRGAITLSVNNKTVSMIKWWILLGKLTSGFPMKLSKVEDVMTVEAKRGDKQVDQRSTITGRLLRVIVKVWQNHHHHGQAHLVHNNTSAQTQTNTPVLVHPSTASKCWSQNWIWWR